MHAQLVESMLKQKKELQQLNDDSHRQLDQLHQQIKNLDEQLAAVIQQEKQTQEQFSPTEM